MRGFWTPVELYTVDHLSLNNAFRLGIWKVDIGVSKSNQRWPMETGGFVVLKMADGGANAGSPCAINLVFRVSGFDHLFKTCPSLPGRTRAIWEIANASP